MNAFWRAGCFVAAAAFIGVVIQAGATDGEPTDDQRVLIDALVEARIETDALRSRLEALSFGRRDVLWTPDSGEGRLDLSALETLRVLDVNRDLQMVIIGGGRRAGLQAGMSFLLMRDDAPTAQVRLVDVRREISGAVIERTEKGRTAAVTDRPVLLRELP